MKHGNLHVCSLVGAKEFDLSKCSAVITIEDTTAKSPFRIDDESTAQLVLRFDDIREAIDAYIPPNESIIRSALEFGRRFVDKTIMIHCHAGSSRSPAIALAIIADRLGSGQEGLAVDGMFEIAKWASPNIGVVEIADNLLERQGLLVSALLPAHNAYSNT